MPGADGEDVAAHILVTQLGRLDVRGNSQWHRLNFSFRCGLRPDDDGYVSVLEGRLSVEQAVPLIDIGNLAGSADGVRWAETGSLQKADFKVVYKPLPTIPDHIGVYWDGEWDDVVAASFNRCFTECARGPIGDE